MSKIVLISSGSPATNPRLVKEANALHGAGYNVHVLYSHVIDWAEALDEKIIAKAQWSAELVGGSPTKERITFVVSSWWFKCVRRILWMPFRRKRLTRTSLLLVKRAKQCKADLYIAHNLGALAAAVLAARRQGTKAAFDAEDYHLGEFQSGSPSARITQRIENEWIPQCTECWSASPLITEAYRRRFPELSFHVIDNVFPVNLQLPFEPLQKSPLRFVWFSQTIGAGRGLEKLFSALQSCPRQYWELTLIGRVDRTFEPEIRAFQSAHPHSVNIMPPMEERDLFKEITQHHIGLALETATPLNRDMCRTNKLFSYILSGCYLLLTDTRAQKEFLESHPQCGTLLPIEATQEWVSIIYNLLENPKHLKEQRHRNWTLGKDRLNWDVQQGKLLSIVSALLNQSNSQKA